MATEDRMVWEMFTLVVDYARPLKDSIKAGRYDYVNENITEANFPADKDGRGTRKVKVRLIQFARRLYRYNSTIESAEAIREMEWERCRPATLQNSLLSETLTRSFRGDFRSLP